MPQPAKYKNNAARQAAYRARCQQARQEALQEKGLPPLPAIASLPGWTRWKASLTAAHALLEQVSQEMQTYFDERSEAWQESERAQEMLTRLEALEEVRDQIQALL